MVTLKGATQGFRISPEGSAMWVECTTGKVWYYLVRPKDSLDFRTFGNTQAFLANFETEDILEGYSVEGVLLIPGVRLFIRPCTPYAFLTVENSVLSGGYFYSLSTMHDTFFGLVHSLVNSSSISHCNKPHFRHLIRLVVQYAHMALVNGDDSQLPLLRHDMGPEGISMANVEGLFAVICLGIFSNALDPDSYKLCADPLDKSHFREQIATSRMEMYDYNAMPLDDRAGCTFARGCAYELRDWFCHHYQITGRTETAPVLVHKIIANQACAILKANLAASGNKDLKLFTPDAIKRQILNTFRDENAEWSLIAAMIAQLEQGRSSPLMYLSLEGCTISRMDNAALYCCRTTDEIQKLGTSPLDERFQRGVEASFEVALSGSKKRRVRK